MNRFISIVALALSFALVGCATKPVPVVRTPYKGAELTYPGVYKALKAEMAKVNFDKVDIYTNSFTTGTFTIMDLTTPNKMEMVVALNNGTFTYQLLNQAYQNSQTKAWTPTTRFLVYNPESLFGKIDAKISAILANPASYSAAKVEALSDWAFVHAIIRNQNAIMLKDFVEKELSTRKVAIAGEVIEVKEVNETINGKTYRFKATASYNISKIENPGEMSSALDKRFAFTIYSNNATVASLNKGSPIGLQGTVISVGPGMFSNEFLVSVVVD